MKRIYNFSAGPSMLPVEVLSQAANEMLDYQGSGCSVMEMSHRSPVYDNIIKQAEADLRTLMEIPENYRTCGWCYNEMMKVLPDSLALLEQQGYAPEIVAWCWMQGEADACEEQHMPHYERRYDAMLSDLRARFAKYFAADCRFIDAGISQTWPFHVQMNELERAYAAKIPGGVFVDTIGQGLTVLNEPQHEVDVYHYDSDSTIKLGHLFAQHI